MEHSRQQANRPRLTSNKVMDFDGFVDTLSALLETVWGENWGTFRIARPTTNDSTSIKMPQITYSLKQMTPGKVGKDTKEIKPRLRESVEGISSLTGEPTIINIYGQRMDCEVEFAVYTENNQETLQLAKNFRAVLTNFKGVLLQEGLHNIWFVEDVDRSEHENLENKVASRGLTYRVSIEEITKEEVATIKSFSYQVDVVKNKLELEGKLPSQQ